MKIITKSEKETFKLAQKFATKLRGGEVLALIGDLGAGKTAFVKGLAEGLGVKNIITSPTFVLMKGYTAQKQKNKKAKKQLIHIDAYRLSSGKELEDIGATEYFSDKNTIVAIEWADRVKDILPAGVIKINFKILEGDKRKIEIK
ncbi:MAG: tRNA (adenosine(37)-N6)-threonylcarbamoyltransferase complex ATPase subunit type 1 TsaE [Patescibacteria group bacterium]